jgi:ribosomal protein S15P/S13E
MAMVEGPKLDHFLTTFSISSTSQVTNNLKWHFTRNKEDKHSEIGNFKQAMMIDPSED